MLLELRDAARLYEMADRRTGTLEFDCSCLGLFEGIQENLKGPLRDQFIYRAKQEMEQNPKGFAAFFGGMRNTRIGGSAHKSYLDGAAKAYWETVQVLCGESKFQRAVADLTDKEIAVLKAVCANTIAFQHVEEQQVELKRYLLQINAKLVWAGGRSQLLPSSQHTQYPAEAIAAADLARLLMRFHICEDPNEHEQEIGKTLGEFVELSKHPAVIERYPEAARAIADALNPTSAIWMDTSNLENSPFKVFEAGKDLFLGDLKTPTGEHVSIGFAGNESLVTIAQPGAGKTQCQVLPNLFMYQGSIVALDPKLELMELTAGKRQADGHRVIVLNLAGDDQPTHRFNVLEFIDRRPEYLWNGVIELAEFLIPANPHENNPIFRNKATELLATCLGGVILAETEETGPATLSGAIRKIFSSIESLETFFFDTSDRAEDAGSEPLAQSAMGFAKLLNNENTVEDFLRYQSNATSVLMRYRGGVVDRVANGKSDWAPEDLRETGTTLYIRIPYEEMEVYGGFVRMVLYTLIKRLRKGGTEAGGLPITFLLDEVAQLGNLDQIANVIETGRGYGLRAWLIFQDYEQAKTASRKPNLLLKTPKVRLFMNPSLETAKEISEELGEINQVITGKDKSLAEPFELMGEQYANDIVVLSSGSRPMRLSKWFAYQDPDYEKLTGLQSISY